MAIERMPPQKSDVLLMVPRGEGLVTMYGNRPAITDTVIAEHFGPVMRQWVRDNCERVPNADVWLLPMPPDEGEQT